MAFLKGIGGADIEADATPQALRSVLYDQFGRPLGRKQGVARNEANDEAFLIAGVNDGNIRHFRTDRTGGQAVALNSLLFSDQFEGATINANKWFTTSTTMTAAQVAASGLNFNNGNSVATAVGFLARTHRTFYKPLRSILHAKVRFQAIHYAGGQFEMGFGDCSTFNGANANGCYLQVKPDGVVQLVWTKDTADQIIQIPGLVLNATTYYTADIIMDDEQFTAIIQDTSTGLIVAEKNIALPLGAAKQFTNSRLYGFARQFHVSAPATAPRFTISTFDVVMMDNTQQKPWSTLMAAMGQGSGFNPLTGVQAAQFANSAAPASAALANITAGYATLGGLFQFAAVLGAVTDYLLFAFQVPAPFSFHCTGIDIESWNQGAAVATTPHLLLWGMGINQAAASLATAGIVKKMVGAQSFPIGAAIGAKAERIEKEFTTPEVTDAGRFLTVILRMPTATATASQVIQGMVNINGYFE